MSICQKKILSKFKNNLIKQTKKNKTKVNVNSILTKCKEKSLSFWDKILFLNNPFHSTLISFCLSENTSLRLNGLLMNTNDPGGQYYLSLNQVTLTD